MSYTAEKRFLLVTIGFAKKVKTKELEPVFDRAANWLRYTPNCWLLLTTKSPNTWAARLQPHLDEKDHYFIVEINISERQGRLPKWMWEWIREKGNEVEMKGMFDE